MKMCGNCKIEKPEAEFAKNKSKHDGLQYRCLLCFAKYRKENREAILENKREHYRKNRERLLQEKKDGYKAVADVKRTYQREYYGRNTAEINKKSKEYIVKNPDYYKEFRKKHPEKLNAKEIKRKTAKINRTPSWLTEDDFWMIEEAYHLAAQRTELFGFKWHVDHIIPLAGKHVSGLHVPGNLQVIPWHQNLKKSNKFEVF